MKAGSPAHLLFLRILHFTNTITLVNIKKGEC